MIDPLLAKEPASPIPPPRRMRASLAALTLLPALLACSCALVDMATPSGRPEMTFEDATRQEVLSELVIEFSAEGFYVEDENHFSILFSKHATRHARPRATRDRPARLWKIRCTSAERWGVVHLAANIEAVTDPGTEKERSVDSSRNTIVAVEVQKIFDRIAERLARGTRERAR